MPELDVNASLEVPESITKFVRSQPQPQQIFSSPKAFEAMANARAYGMSEDDAISYSEQLEQEKRDDRSMFEKFSGAKDQLVFEFDRTALEIEDALNWYELMGNPEKQELLDRKREIAEQINALGIDERTGLLEEVSGAVGNLSRYLYESGKKGLTGYLAAGLPTTGLLAATGVGAPVSIPAGLVAGKWGAAVSAGAFIARVEAGAAYKEMVEFKDPETGEQIDPQIARATAYGVGVLNGLLELAQIKTIARTIPGGELVLRKSIRETGKKLLQSRTYQGMLARFVASYGPAVGTNILQEVAQESVTVMGNELARVLTNNLKDTNISGTTAEDFGARIRETAIEAGKGFSVIMLPGPVMTAYMGGKSKEDIKTIIEEEEKKGPIEPVRLGNYVPSEEEIQAQVDNKESVAREEELEEFETASEPRQRELIDTWLGRTRYAENRAAAVAALGEEKADAVMELVEARAQAAGYTSAEDYMQSQDIRFVQSAEADVTGEQMTEDVFAEPAVFAQSTEVPLETATQNIKSNPNFVEWFGDSVVVDKDGEPLVVYHGTREYIKKFDTDGVLKDSVSAGFGSIELLGSSFTTNPVVADSFIKHKVGAKEGDYVATPDGTRRYPFGGSIYPVYLNIKNPKKFRTVDALRKEIYEVTKAMTNGLSGLAYHRVAASKYKKYLKKNGYDGVTFQEGTRWKPTSRKERGQVYIPIENTQIKSIFNEGTYSKTDPRILKQSQSGNKGAVVFEESAKIMHLFENADVSTIVHELAHIWRRELSPETLKRIETWAGAKDGVWSVAAEEKFARAFEKYLRDGKAPSEQLKSAFESFKEWLLDIYQTLTGSSIDIEISPEVRQVFDSLLTEQEVGESDGPRTLFQSASLRSGEEDMGLYGLDPGKRYKTREVAAALETRQRHKYGSIARDDRSDEASTKISKWMAEEVLFEMRNPDNSGVGWYSEKFQRALDTMGNLYGELKTDKNARSTMTALIAITSDGQKVVPNFSQALEIYGNFRETGEFVGERSHQRQASIKTNLKNLQDLYKKLTREEVHNYLLKELTISELKQIAKKHGFEMKSDYQAHVRMPMAAVILGPKIGAFYANLMGAHGYLTMDRWWSRTFNRYRGNLITDPTEVGLERFRKLLGQEDLSDDETIAASVRYRKSYEARGFKKGTELEKAANTIYKAAFENMNDAPFNATDRTFMLDAVNKSQKVLKRKKINISIADIQAILWYYEKRLYGELGARQTADISYEEAAEKVVSGYANRPGEQSVHGSQVRQKLQGNGKGTARKVPVGEEGYTTVLFQKGDVVDPQYGELEAGLPYPLPSRSEMQEFARLQGQAQSSSELLAEKRFKEIEEQLKKDSVRQAKKSVQDHPVLGAMDEAVKGGGLSLDQLSVDYDKATIKELVRKRPGLLSRKSSVSPDEFAADHGFETLDEMVTAFLEAPKKKDYIEDMARQIFDEQMQYDDAARESLTEPFRREEESAELDRLAEDRPTPFKALKGIIRETTGQSRRRFDDRRWTDYDALVYALRRSASASRAAKAEGIREGRAEMKEQLPGKQDVISARAEGKRLKYAEMRAIIERARLRRREQGTRRELKNRIKNELKRTKVKDGKSKFGKEAQKFLDVMRSAAKMTQEQAQNAIAENLAAYPDQGQPIPFDKVMENRIYSMILNLDTMDNDSLAKLLQDIKDFKDSARGEMLAEYEERKARWAQERADIVRVITGGEGLPEGYMTTGTKVYESQGLVKDFKRKMITIGKAFVGWKDINDMLSYYDKGSRPGESRLSELTDVLDAKNSEKQGVADTMRQIKDAAMRIYGLTSEYQMWRKFNKDAEIVDLGMFENRLGIKVQIRMSKAEARKRVMELLDPSLEINFLIDMSYTDEIVKAIRNMLDPQDEEFISWQMAFYSDYYQSVNNVYSKMNGVDLPFNKFYSPIKREGTGNQETESTTFSEFLQETAYRMIPKSGSLIARQANKHRIMQQSDIAVLQKHILEMEHYKAWAERVRDLNAIMLDGDVTTAIRIRFGNEMNELVTFFLHKFARGGQDRSQNMNWLDRFRGNFTRSVLALKPSLTIKQLTSLPAYADAMPIAPFVKNVGLFFANPIANYRMLKDSSVLLATRGENIERDIKAAAQTPIVKGWGNNPSFNNLLMLNIKLGDQAAIVVGGWAYYKHLIDTGSTHEEAIRKFEQFTESTQQSADESEQSYVQSLGSVAKVFTMFSSSINQYLRKEMGAIRNLKAGRISTREAAKTIAIYHFLLPMVFQWASDRFEWEEDEQLRAAILGPLNGFFIFGEALDGMIRTALGLPFDDFELSIFAPFRDMQKVIRNLKHDDFGAEETLAVIRAAAGAAGAVTGLPGKQAVDIATGISDVAKGDVEQGVTEIFGWSPFKAKELARD